MPEVFFDAEGEKINKAGFDAVVGNPPWALISDEGSKEYLSTKYEHQSGKPDLFRFFIEKSTEITAREHGMVTPSSWLTMAAAEALRYYLLDEKLITQVSKVPQSAFEGVKMNMITYRVSKGEAADHIEVYDLGEMGGSEFQFDLSYNLILDNGGRIEVGVDSNAQRLTEQINNKTSDFGEYSESTTGYQLYHNTIHSSEEMENAVYHSSTKETDNHVPEIGGGSIHQFWIDETPKGFVDTDTEFYRLPAERFRQGSRVLIREITSKNGIRSAHTTSEILFPKSVIALRSDEYPEPFFAALLNSDLLFFVFNSSGEKSTQELFPRVSMSDLAGFPFPAENAESEVQHPTSDIDTQSQTYINVLTELANRQESLKSKRKMLNVRLIDHIDDSRSSIDLPEFGLLQPVGYDADKPLHRVSSELDSLRVGSVTVTRESPNTVLIEATARYKPDDEDGHETDQWGYTETEYLPAFRITDLTEREADLIEHFVPVAVDEAGGFANFRETATKTNSLIDRLKAIELPDIDDVADDLENYLKTKERAEELDEKIEQTDQLIDEIVYELYGLTDEEIEIVEEAVGE